MECLLGEAKQNGTETTVSSCFCTHKFCNRLHHFLKYAKLGEMALQLTHNLKCIDLHKETRKY